MELEVGMNVKVKDNTWLNGHIGTVNKLPKNYVNCFFSIYPSIIFPEGYISVKPDFIIQ